jgi:hypothetical protein
MHFLGKCRRSQPVRKEKERERGTGREQEKIQTGRERERERDVRSLLNHLSLLPSRSFIASKPRHYLQ